MEFLSTTGVKSQLIDILAYLPVSGHTLECRKGQIIYDWNNPSTNLYLVTTGKVKLTRLRAGRSPVLLEIVRPDELFGESALLNVSGGFEQAVALEKAQLVTWSASTMEDLVLTEPRLGVAILQLLAQRCIESTRRIESLSLDSVQQRLANSLIYFSDRLGTREEDGTIRMIPFTHQMLAQYIGTSREIVTVYMNQFRKQGYLRYSRKGITLYRDTFHKSLY